MTSRRRKKEKVGEESSGILGKKISRRQALSTGAKVGIAAVGGLIVGGVAGYFAKPAAPAETITKTVTQATTVTKTVTATAAPTTVTTTAPPATTGYPPGLGPEDEPYIKAAYDFIDWVGDMTVLSRKELEEEVLHYVRASKPYRGQTLHIMYEAVPGAVWEENNLKEWFEKITGIKTTWESMSNWETILKSLEDAKTKSGIYDLLGTDQDMNAFYIYNQSAVNISELLRKFPELEPPHFDVEDFFLKASYSDSKGDLYALHAYNAFAGTVYRKDWLTDPKEKEDFKKQYGYELKTPMEYFMDAQKSGNIEDDWTTDKAKDIAEFFTRPDENKWGYVTGVRPGDHMGWYIADGLDDCFQLASPAPDDKWPLEVNSLEPVTTPWGISIRDGKIYGASTKEGGTLDSEAGQAMYKWWLNDSLKYTPEKVYEMDVVEAHTAFQIDGTYATMWPYYFHWATLLAGPESAVKGKFEFAPYPAYAPAWNARKPRGYIDPSGWIISAYSSKPQAAFLFASFMTSKAVELKKNLEVGLPVRWSTIQDPRFKAKDEEWGGVITVIEKAGKLHFGTDSKMVIYPHILPLTADAGSDALQKKMPGPEIAKYVASEIDKWIKDNGWYEKEVKI